MKRKPSQQFCQARELQQLQGSCSDVIANEEERAKGMHFVHFRGISSAKFFQTDRANIISECPHSGDLVISTRHPLLPLALTQ